MPDEGRTELIEELVRQHQVMERLAEALAAQAYVCGLGLNELVILLEGDGRGTGILAHLVARSGQVPACVGEREHVVVAQHALHFQDVLLAELVEHGLQHAERELDPLMKNR